MTGTEVDGPSIQARFTGRLGAFRLDADFTAPGRGVTALVGPSGGGKTTLLRCIAGLTRLSGSLRIGDQVWQDDSRFLPPHRRAVGYVFQEPSLLAHLSVRGNLLYGFKRSGDRRKVAFDDVVSLLGVGAILDRSPHRLSGGERQRVAIGRALLSQPDLLLMDEPVSSLDPDSKAEILPYLDRLHQTLAIPVLYVSHDMKEVARLADRVLVMTDGRISPAPADAGLAAARGALAALDGDRISGLALAALLAGLEPIPDP